MSWDPLRSTPESLGYCARLKQLWYQALAMVSLAPQILTLDAFLREPETKPAREYIDGQILAKPMPKAKHSRIQFKLTEAINNQLETHQTAVAFPELRCTFGERSIVPDIVVITWDRIPLDQDGDVANDVKVCPDWIIEILSPDQSQTQLTRKILTSLDWGCQMGWLIDPAEKTVLVYPAQGSPSFGDMQDPEQVLAVPDFGQAVQLSVSTLFGWMQIQAPLKAIESDSD